MVSGAINKLVLKPALVLLTLGLFLVSARADSSLDLSPQLQPFELEGIKMWQLTFSNGTSKKAIYQPPQGWKYSGGRDSLELQPASMAQARAVIAKLPPAMHLAFDEEGRKQLRERAIAALPQGSQQAKITSDELNPLQIDGQQTYLIEISYLFFGQKFACYSLVLDRKPEAMSFRLTSLEADYGQLRDAFQRSLFTWQNL
jgi:hypothetical protein